MNSPVKTQDRAGAILIWSCVVSLGYILSIGPATVLLNNSDIPADLLEKIYAPVIWLHHHTPLSGMIDGYIDLWSGLYY